MIEIKITIQQDQKQTISTDFTNPQDALNYLQSLVPAVEETTEELPTEDEIVDTEEELSDPLPEGEKNTDFTNEQRFDPGQHIMFHQHVGQYSGEHVVIEERAEAVGYSYRTDKSGDTFIHAHWFKPVTE